MDGRIDRPIDRMIESCGMCVEIFLNFCSRRRAGAAGSSPQIPKMYGNNQSGIGNSNASSYGSSAKTGGGGGQLGGSFLYSMSFSKVENAFFLSLSLSLCVCVCVCV